MTISVVCGTNWGDKGKGRICYVSAGPERHSLSNRAAA